MDALGLILLAGFLYWFFTSAGRARQEKRLQTLEAQVRALQNETRNLRAMAIRREGASEEPPVTPAVPGLPPGMPPIPREPVVRPAASPAITTDDTPTQPGIEFPAPAGVTPGLVERLFSGNILAKIGVVLLFFGVASGLRLAADHGLFPVQLRLILGAVAGLGMIVFGWSKAREARQAVEKGAARAFALSLQGGGFAILYLVVYFMLARYHFLEVTPAFVLFALLGVACVLLAARQEGVVLAVFGLAGAFGAPVLAARGGGDPLALFAYFALLNLFIVGVSWFRQWRVLNVTGFLLTLGLGMGWAVGHYQHSHHEVVEFFLVFFWVLYSAVPVLMARFRAPGWAGWADGMLAFGVPLAGFALQAQLTDSRYELAWAALAAALWYGVLWAILFRQRETASEVLERCQLGLALAFGTLAVPLAFGVQVTVAFWALEGVAVVWFGVRQGRRLAQFTGSLLQVAAGLYFLTDVDHWLRGHFIFNDLCLGGLLLAGAGYGTARLLDRQWAAGSGALLLWAMAWWLGVGFHEINEFAPRVFRVELGLFFVAATLWLTKLHAVRRDWPAARIAGWLPALALVLGFLVANFSHAGATGGLPYLPLLNAFDGVLLLCLFVLAGWLRALSPNPRGSHGLLGGLAFVGLSGLAARLAHHWWGVPFNSYALWHSSTLQAMLTLLWTALAIGAMIRASRLGVRRLWQGGFALLAVVGGKLMMVDLANAGTALWTGSLIGVALLVLTAGYLAPVPPVDERQGESGEQGEKR